MGLAVRSTLTVALLMLVVMGVGAGEQEKAVSESRTALLVIDVQNFYFENGRVPLEGPVEAAANARRLLDAFRKRGWPVVHVQHLPKGVEVPDPAIADEQYRIHPTLTPVPGEELVGKHRANAFRQTELAELLRGLGVGRLVIAGMQTHMCVEAATRAAADLGFEVTVVHDACATRALGFGGVHVPAAHVHAAALAALEGSYATVVSTREWLAGSGRAGGLPGGANQ